MSAEFTLRRWPDGRTGEQITDAAEALRDAEHDTGLRWLDCGAPTKDELTQLAEQLGITDDFVENTLDPLERPKLAFQDGAILFVTYATLKPHEFVRLSGWVLGDLVVTVRSSTDFSIAPIMRDADPQEDDADATVNRILYTVLDAVVDTHFAAIQELDSLIDDLEEELFTTPTLPTGFSREMYLVRKANAHLRRVVLPMREVAVGLERHRIADRKDLWFQDLEDHVLRAVEWTESLRDVLTGLVDTQLQLQDQRTNMIMKKLAAWAAIIAVPTLITGWFGQNVPYPGFSQPSGLWYSLLLIVGSVSGMWYLFKKIDWL